MALTRWSHDCAVASVCRPRPRACAAPSSAISPKAPDPELDAVTAAFLGAEAKFVVIGGFAVIAHEYVRATEDVDLLIPEDPANDERCEGALASLEAVWASDGTPLSKRRVVGRDHSRLLTRCGLVDLLREGSPPLDFATVAKGAERADLGSGEFLLAGLASLVSFKRLAGRPRDRLDLEELEVRHGELPIEELPGFDS